MTGKTLWINLVFCILLILSGPRQVAHAQSGDAREIIDAVNRLRAENGLAPYEVDAGLMAYAQEQADYIASTGVSTHLRADGTVSGMFGISENVAGGDIGFITPQVAVSEVWADPVHMKTMVGHESGTIGVGVAVSGGTVHYVLNVHGSDSKPWPEAASTPAPDAARPTAAQVIPISPLVRATPLADGALYHQVGYGHTLIKIAELYGVSVAEIRSLNGMAVNAEAIYAGQKLLIRPPGTAAAPPEASATDTPASPAPPQTSGAPESAAGSAEATTVPAGGGEGGGLSAMQTAGYALLFGGALMLAVWLGLFLKEEK